MFQAPLSSTGAGHCQHCWTRNSLTTSEIYRCPACPVKKRATRFIKEIAESRALRNRVFPAYIVLRWSYWTLYYFKYKYFILSK